MRAISVKILYKSIKSNCIYKIIIVCCLLKIVTEGNLSINKYICNNNQLNQLQDIGKISTTHCRVSNDSYNIRTANAHNLLVEKTFIDYPAKNQTFIYLTNILLCMLASRVFEFLPTIIVHLVNFESNFCKTLQKKWTCIRLKKQTQDCPPTIHQQKEDSNENKNKNEQSNYGDITIITLIKILKNFVLNKIISSLTYIMLLKKWVARRKLKVGSMYPADVCFLIILMKLQQRIYIDNFQKKHKQSCTLSNNTYHHHNDGRQKVSCRSSRQLVEKPTESRQLHQKADAPRIGKCSYNCTCYCCVEGCCIETCTCWLCSNTEKVSGYLGCSICSGREVYAYFQSNHNDNSLFIATGQISRHLLSTKHNLADKKLHKVKSLHKKAKIIYKQSCNVNCLEYCHSQLFYHANTSGSGCFFCLNTINLSFQTIRKDFCQKILSICCYCRNHLLPALFVVVPLTTSSSYKRASRVQSHLGHQSMKGTVGRVVLTDNKKHNCTHTSLKANDQQLKTNNLCKMFCNNRKRHRRRKRRRRRRCVTHVEQQKHHQKNHEQLVTNHDEINISVSNNLLWSLWQLANAKSDKTISTTLLSSEAVSSSPSTLKVFIAATAAFRTDQSISIGKPTKRRSTSNLVWLLIGLVWFDNPRIVNCISISSSPIQQTIKVTTHSISKPFNSTLTFFNKPQKTNLSHSQIVDTDKIRQDYFWNNRLATSSISNKSSGEYYHDVKFPSISFQNTNKRLLDYENEDSVQSDLFRLESIKQQILNRLGLKRKPNVLHPLPKQYIWETIYRADGISTVSDIDLNVKRRRELIRFLPVANLEQNTRNIINNTYTQMRLNSQKRSKSSLIFKNNNSKFSPENFQNIVGIDNDNENNYQQDLSSGMGFESINQDLLENDDNSGNTQEIITFAEKGNMYLQHRLVDFLQQSTQVSGQKLYIRKAEIHIKIERISKTNSKKPGKNFEHNQNNRKGLKVWIFEIKEKNHSIKNFDQDAHLCGGFEVNTKYLGWKKFDVTETVKKWYELRDKEKLRLLIDCTGCNQQYKLVLFEKNTYLSKSLAEAKFSKPIHMEKLNQKDKFPILNKINYSVQFGKNELFAIKNKQRRPANKGKDWKKFFENQSEQSEQIAEEKHLQAKVKHNQDQYLNRPFLVMHTETQRPRRVRRRAVDCSGALHGQCCKESFYVSFKALGWDDWIIAPRGYFANYCRGDCTGPFRTPDTFQTFHAHFIEEYRKMGLLNGMKPCCAPIKFSSMSLIYYGEDGIIKRDLPKMVVDECGCP